nr:DExH-box ATP-dependent RNA helicase DExH17-like isoform X8 [Physcomitrium patens]|eukprot:XP_024376302.1 DExH-box ATP-dependent RNA helicase DExH17-like isoform X8 [Physcomitrella patens]
MDPRLDPDYLKPVSLLPTAFQSVFPFRYFNAVQSESFAEVFLSDDNLVISAPTGSGKTVLFELCILRLLEKFLTTEGHFKHVSGARKAVYIAPMKALVQDKLRDWTLRFSSLGVKCQELTGDSGPTNVGEMIDTDIILTTPEKFDVITRRHRDRGGMSFFGDIALILIDEVHLLSETRGAALEAVVSRLKMLARFPEIKGSPLSTIRFVAVSATVPNIEDLAEWLHVPKNGMKRLYSPTAGLTCDSFEFRFGEEYRPVKLTTTVLGYQPAKNDFLFERRLQQYLLDILLHHSEGKPSLVFCSTRKGAQDTAVALSQSVSQHGNHNPFVKNLEHFKRLQLAAQRTNDVHMQQCIRSGVGYHNGGLSMEDRGLIEGLFLTGDLLVLCTTSTLAQGVNLPAHAVIIKSTQYYNKLKGCYVEYERSAILQMSGRAGRPQFDDSGVVVIMTRKDSVHLYHNLLSGSEPVESQLLSSIVEHLNAEIVLMTVSDCSQAIDWLKCSYLYVRIKKNPQYYCVKQGVPRDQLENKLKDICVQNVNELAKYGMVKTDEFGYVLTPLEPGRIMEKYYMQFETMKAITKAAERATIEELLHVLANAAELSWIKLRRDEKKRLNDINGDISGRIRYHVNNSNGKLKKRIQSGAEKIFILVNDALSGEPSVTDFTMSQDINGICTTGTRICRCMSEYFIFMKRFTEIRNALLLSKCLKQRLWESTKYQLKQLVGVGLVTAKALITAGVDSFEKLASADPRRLEAITGRKFPYGDQLKASLNDAPPKVEMNLFESERDDQCLLTLHRVSQSQSSGKNFHMAELVVGSMADNMLIFRERIRMDQFTSPYAVTITSSSPSDEPLVLVAALISEEYVGVDVVCKLVINRDSRDDQLGLNEDYRHQGPQTSMTRFYISSPFKASFSINDLAASSARSHATSVMSSPLIKNKTLDSPRAQQTAASNIPIMEALSRYPSRHSNPCPATLATRNFLNKIGTDIDASDPLKDTFLRTLPIPAKTESNTTPGSEVLATCVIKPSKSPSSKSGHADHFDILTTLQSSDLVETSICNSVLVPTETYEKSPRTSSFVTPKRKDPPSCAPRRLFRRLCTRFEENRMTTSLPSANGKTPNPSQSEEVSIKSTMCNGGPCSMNDIGFTENYADQATTSIPRNDCGSEKSTKVTTLLYNSKVRTHDNVELQAGVVSDMTHQDSGPSEDVTASAPPSLTSLSTTPDLLSSDMRRKIRRTGFSSISCFSSVKNNDQRNSMVTLNIAQPSSCQPRCPDRSDEPQNIKHRSRILQSFPSRAPRVTDAVAQNSPHSKVSDQLTPWRATAGLIPTGSSVGAAKERNSFSQGPNNIKITSSTRRYTASRLEAASCALIDRPLKQIAPYKALKSFDFGSSRKPPPDVARGVNPASEIPEPLDQAASISNTRLKAEDLGFVTVEVPSNHNSSTKKFSCLRFDQSHITARSSSSALGESTTAQPSPAGQHEFMGYKSLFSFL